MNKAKPCMNDKCIENNTISESRCNLYDRGCIDLNRITDCFLYQPEKPTTIWEKRWYGLKKLLRKHGIDDFPINVIIDIILEIMQQIEKEEEDG